MPAPELPSFSRPTWAEVNLTSLRANARTICGEKATPLIAVVKANAYGHGAVATADALADCAAAFAVASVDEGRDLRQAGIELPILLLSAILPDEAAAVVEADLTATVSTLEVARALQQSADAQKKTAAIHWKIDTGMGRVGTWHEGAAEFWRSLGEFSRLEIAGVYTHFACADDGDSSYTQAQIAQFENALKNCGILPSEYLLHAANSAGALRFPQAHYGAVRAGIALYGASPFGMESRPAALQPVMSLKARITEVRTVARGRNVSYGATWTAPRDCKLALVPLGYADGFLRCLSNVGEVLVRGQRCPVAGRVTMDQVLVDITEVQANVPVGEIVTAWGEDESGNFLPVEEVAAKANTISYELLAGVPARVPRVYHAPEAMPLPETK